MTAETSPAETSPADVFGPVIYAYTRAQALADGTLHAVPDAMLREAAIVFPMAVTAAVWADCVAWTDADTDRTGIPQDETGRLWDVVFMTRFALVRAVGPTDRASVQLHRVPRDGGTKAEPVTLIAVCGPGDNAEPVITIMQVDES